VDISSERFEGWSVFTGWIWHVLLEWPETFTFIGRSRPEGYSLSCDALIGHAVATAGLLKSRGIGADDRVALWLTDGQDHVAAMLGCWIVGTAFCVLPAYAGRTGTTLSKDRTDNVLSVLQPRLFVQGQHAQLPESIVKDFGTLDLFDLDVVPCDTDAAKSAIGHRPSAIATPISRPLSSLPREAPAAAPGGQKSGSASLRPIWRRWRDAPRCRHGIAWSLGHRSITIWGLWPRFCRSTAARTLS